MPLHVLAQEEREYAPSFDAPSARQLGHDFLLLVDADQALNTSSVMRSEIVSLLVIGSSVAGRPYSL